MPSSRNKFKTIKYTDRDYESIKKSLNEHRKRYYSNISQDENEASFDDMIMDQVSYIGDILSFYVDYNLNESFINTSIEYQNTLNNAREMGWKFKGNPSSVGIETFYAIIPANSVGLGPNPDYLFTLLRGSELSTPNGNGFILNEDVNFADPTNEIVVARVDEDTGVPTFYAVKAKGQIISGRIVEEIIEVGDFQKFLKIELSGRDISEIISVVDDEGHEYYEVNYLSEDTIYKSIQNRDTSTNTQVPNILKPFIVPRRFVVERERVKTYLQFGFGSENDVKSDPLIDPTEVVLNIFGKDFVTDTSFDPTNLLGSDKLGIAPANTRLKIVYRINTLESVNASADSVINIDNPIIKFNDPTILDSELAGIVSDSIEVTNEKSIVGDVSVPDISEIKIRAFSSFGSQERAVTVPDYKAAVYAMPPKFGAIKRVNIIPDSDSFKRNLNMYVLSEDENGYFTTSNTILKQNLKNWILTKKMINDTIDIIDGKIVNFGVDFVVFGELEKNKFEIKQNAIDQLKLHFAKKMDIGEPLDIEEIRKVLNKVSGVNGVSKINIIRKNGGNYSDTRFNLNSAKTLDGKMIIVPQNVVLELKFVDIDLRGSVL